MRCRAGSARNGENYMNQMLGWIALGGAVLLILWIMGADHSRSMEQCEQTHSRDTCLYTLR